MKNERSPFAQKLSTVLVEYIGTSPDLLHKRYEGKVLKFAPNPAYQDRRVEEFPNEAEATNWIKPYNKKRATFRLVEDMLTEREQKRFEAHVGPLRRMLEHQDERIKALEAQATSSDTATLLAKIEVLEGQLAALSTKPKKKATPRKKEPTS